MSVWIALSTFATYSQLTLLSISQYARLTGVKYDSLTRFALLDPANSDTALVITSKQVDFKQ